MYDTFKRRGHYPQILEGVTEVTKLKQPDTGDINARAFLVPAELVSKLYESNGEPVIYRPPADISTHFTGRVACAIVRFF